MKITELIKEDNGKLSHTKLWSNIAGIVATYAFIKQVYAETLTPEFLGVYLGAFVLQRASSKFISRNKITFTNKKNNNDSLGL